MELFGRAWSVDELRGHVSDMSQLASIKRSSLLEGERPFYTRDVNRPCSWILHPY